MKINPNSTTIWLEWEGDLEISANGSFVLASGWDQVRQRILRRLLTNSTFTLHTGEPVPADYIFDPQYGLCFRRRVGQPWDRDLELQMTELCRQAVVVDQGVDVNREPDINIRQAQHHVYVSITVYLKTGESGKIAFDFGG